MVNIRSERRGGIACYCTVETIFLWRPRRAQCMVNTESNVMQEVNRRINVARTSVQKMDKICKSKAVNHKLKLSLVRFTAFTTASYGSESWTFSRKVQTNWMPSKCGLTNVNYECLGDRKEQMNGCSRSWGPKAVQTDYQQKTEILWSCNEAWWAGEDHHPRQSGRHARKRKTTLQGKVGDMRGRGRPRTAWHSDIEQWVGCKLHQPSQLTEHPDRWRTSMKAAAAPLRANW